MEDFLNMKLSFKKTEFPSVLAGLDSGMYQLGANNFAANKERQEKYIYSDPIIANQFVIAVAEERKQRDGSLVSLIFNNHKTAGF